MQMKKPFLITIPHSGEKVPPQTPWLQHLPEEILMCDVDRFVDRLYQPVIDKLSLPFVKTEWHRYAADLNRVPEDVDCTSVIGNTNSAGLHNRGFHWVVTTYNNELMGQPMTDKVHQELVKLVYEPFHQEVLKIYQQMKSQGFQEIYHIDAHSMPSLGTKMHRDPGQLRADIVVSDCKGASCKSEFRDLVISSYEKAGFRVAYNWPYFGGRLTEQYGEPNKGHHAIQVELNRALYMDEKSKKLKNDLAQETQSKISRAIEVIFQEIK